jgi:hypothetical protein
MYLCEVKRLKWREILALLQTASLCLCAVLQNSQRTLSSTHTNACYSRGKVSNAL